MCGGGGGGGGGEAIYYMEGNLYTAIISCGSNWREACFLSFCIVAIQKYNSKSRISSYNCH